VRVSDEPHWSDPGAYPVADGIHRIPLPLPTDGLRAVNVYAVETEEGLTLIDGGWAIEGSRALLGESLARIGHRVEDITRFLVTHVHRDHYTQAVAVRREVGSHVSLGIGERHTLDLARDWTNQPDPTVAQLVRAGAADVARSWASLGDGMEGADATLWELPDAWLDGDHRLEVGTRTIDAVSTPGHTRGHYVFADLEAGLLFAGDHVLPTITPSIGFESAYATQPLGDFLSSLAKVRAMPDLRLLPAHGAVTGSVHARVDELVAHHEERLRLCLESVEAGRQTAYDVATDLPWTRHARRLVDLDVFNTALASMETMAHLELLAAQGRVVRTETDGVLVYRPLPAR
jgi:glyoxylase-like metal-dependent hydrolase (beta-lactamase superfamily II)